MLRKEFVKCQESGLGGSGNNHGFNGEMILTMLDFNPLQFNVRH